MNTTNTTKPNYKSPVLLGAKESEITAMAANRYQTTSSCCTCTAHGNSRA